MAHRSCVPRQKTIPPIIPCQPELASPRQRLEFAGLRPKPKIVTANGNELVGIRALNVSHLAIASPVRAIHPIIQTPQQPIHPQLLIPLPESRKQHPPLIRAVIAIVILEEQNVRRSRNEQTSVPRQQPIWKRQIRGKHGD